MIEGQPTNSQETTDLKLLAIIHGYCKKCNPNKIAQQTCIHIVNNEDSDSDSDSDDSDNEN